MVEDDAHAVALLSGVPSCLPSANLIDPPHVVSTAIAPDGALEIHGWLPGGASIAFDVNDVIRRLADGRRWRKVQAILAANIVVGCGRIDGVVTGFVANQPLVKAGTLDIDASDKGARFIRFCNIFNVPLVTLVDTPGF